MGKNTLINLVRQQTAANLRGYGLTARQQTLDKVIITLGRMGMSSADLAYFAEKYAAVEKEFCEEILNDKIINKNGKEIPDPQLWAAKTHIDMALKELLEDNFVPYEVRYNFNE